MAILAPFGAARLRLMHRAFGASVGCQAELEVANLVLHLLDGQTERTYGNTCCDTTIGSGVTEQSLEPLLAGLFVAARGALTNRIALPAHRLNLFNVGCIGADGRSLDDLTHLIEQTRASGGWAVLMIHGIGAATHTLHLDTQVHEQLIGWLSRQQMIWTAPFRTIARYIKQHTPAHAEPGEPPNPAL